MCEERPCGGRPFCGSSQYGGHRFGRAASDRRLQRKPITRKISQDEINDVAWKACDTFRGTIDPAQYKDYILVMLFLKYLSDVWKDKQEEYEKEFKGDKERVARRLARERFVLPEGCDYYSLYGQEMNGSTWALCRMNMFLHHKDSARIEWGDTVTNPKLIEKDALMKFDVVVANMPFSLDKWGAEGAEADRFHRFHRGVPPKSKGDYAFLCHMIETAVEGSGKVGAITPHGVLFRGGAEGRIRKALIEENLLEAAGWRSIWKN